MTGYRILIADDDPLARSALSDYLVLTGYEVIAAADGREAVEKARRLRPDAVLLDVQMPGSDGFEALTALRADPALQDVPVLLLTSLSRTNIKVRALDLGADDYIVKPFDRAELVARVRRALRRSARYRELSGTLQGNIANISLPGLLQTLELGRKTARVRFPDLDAEIRLERGFLGSATWRGSEGKEVLCRLLLVPRGLFTVAFEEPSPLPGEDEPGLAVQEALLEAARQLDDIRREAPGLPEWDALVEIAGPAQPALPFQAPPPPGPLSLGELAARLAGSLPESVLAATRALASGAVRPATARN